MNHLNNIYSMKYLKLFEDYDSKLYKSISEEEWNNSVGYDDETGIQFEPFTKVEEDRVIDALRQMGYKDEDILDNDGMKRFPSILNLLSDDGLSITKLSDEWFYVYDKMEFNFYKCDTIEGLLQCLKEKFNNEN